MRSDSSDAPRAGHAFLNDEQFGPRPVHPLLRIAGVDPDPESSADAWRRIEAFFHTHLERTTRE